MAKKMEKRNYSIIGPQKKSALENGLVAAEWYASPIPRQRMKELMKRKDGPAIRDTIIWFTVLIILGLIAYKSWGTWWSIPVFLAYGITYTLPANSRWHETGHGTAFKTPWMNEALYQISSFMCLFPATPWRWSHTRHHTDTIIIGRDPEVVSERPPVWLVLLSEVFRLQSGPRDMKRVFLHCFGVLDKEEKEYIPVSEHGKVFWEARVWGIIFLVLAAACVYMQSILPVMFVVLPTFYGFIGVLVTGMVQHLGLNEDVLDHRLNCRTFYTNPIIRFLYWNMNYHIEHHMFPMVPYHALPSLHEEMKADCPTPSPSLWAALKEVLGAITKQRKDPTYTIVRPLPSTACPYKYGPSPYGTIGTVMGNVKEA